MKSRRATLAIGATALAVCLLVVAFKFSSPPSLVSGAQITVVFTKDAWVRCLSHPETEGELVSVTNDGIVVQERTENIFAVTQESTGRAQCQTEGIRTVDAATRRFFVPFTAVQKVLSGNEVVWSK